MNQSLFYCLWCGHKITKGKFPKSNYTSHLLISAIYFLFVKRLSGIFIASKLSFLLNILKSITYSNFLCEKKKLLKYSRHSAHNIKYPTYYLTYLRYLMGNLRKPVILLSLCWIVPIHSNRSVRIEKKSHWEKILGSHWKFPLKRDMIKRNCDILFVHYPLARLAAAT